MAQEQQVDLNGEGSTDYGDKTPFLPFGDGTYTTRLLKIYYHKGFKAGKTYRAKVKVLKSDRADVKEGHSYALQFKIGGEKETQIQARARQIRAFVAAHFGADPSDKSFDGNGALKTLCDLSNADALAKDAESTFDVEIVCRDKQVEENGKKLTNSDGSPKMVTNQFYNPVT